MLGVAGPPGRPVASVRSSVVAGSPGRKGRCALAGACRGLGLQSRRAPDMPEEAGFPPAKRFRPECGPPGGRVVMLLTAGGGGGGGGRRQQQPVLAQPAASPYPEAVERQRRSLPIFQARGQLLAQLRNLDSAVLIGEWPRLVLRPARGALACVSEPAPERPRGGSPSPALEAPTARVGQRPRCPAESRAGDFGACKSVGPSRCGRRPRGRAFGAWRWGGACCLGAACRGDSGGTERMSFRGRKISGSVARGTDAPARAHNTGSNHADPIERSFSRAVAGGSSFVTGLSRGEGGKAVRAGSCWRKGRELRDSRGSAQWRGRLKMESGH